MAWLLHALKPIGRFFEHAGIVAVGFILVIVGLAMGVSMVMLPMGIVIGLVGIMILVAGVFARFD